MSKKRKRPWLRIVVVVPIVLVIAAASFVGANAATKKKATAAATQRTVQATVGTMNETVSASGTLAPADTENLNFSASGNVTAVNVKAGQKVVKGQVLATINSASLQATVVQAEAKVSADESTLSTDGSNGASSAQVAADQATLSSDQAQLASAQTSLAGATLVSPITGQIASVNLTVGEQLGNSGGSATSLTGSATGSGATNPTASSSNSASNSASSPTATTSSAQIQVVSTKLVVNLSVDDTQIAKLKTGQSATVSATTSSGSSSGAAGGFGGFGGFGGRGGGGAGGGGAASPGNPTAPSGSGSSASTAPTAGKVTSVGVIASASSGVAQFPVVVQVTGSTSGLYSGASAAVTITYKKIANVLEVPTLAVTTTNGTSSVTVSTSGKNSKRTVTTGVTSGGQVQITSGLKAGEQVVLTIPSAPTGTGSNNGSNGSSNFPGGGFRNGTPPAGFGGAGQ